MYVGSVVGLFTCVEESGGSDFTPAYGIQLHDPQLLEYVGAPESARLLSRSPEYWLHHLGHEKTLAAALQLQHDAGLILSNVQVLQQFVTSLNRTSSEASACLGEAWTNGDTCWGVSWSRVFIERSTNEIRALIIDVVNCRSCD